MDNTTSIPNTQSAVPANKSETGLEAIATKMAAMRNQMAATKPTETGVTETASEVVPVAPGSDAESIEPEIVTPDENIGEPTAEIDAPEMVSETKAESTAQDIIDFVEFATENPNAKFKFMRNGKEMIIDAKQAQAILGQGGAIHEEARQLKVERAEFDEWKKEQQAQQAGLTLAMEFVVQPQLQTAYDEIRKITGWNQTFAQQYANTNDEGEKARIQASIKQNEDYINQQRQIINQLKPNIDQFRSVRKQQVAELLENSRKAFTDKELKNAYIFNELRDRMVKEWKDANAEIVPGIQNIDLIMSDELVAGLIRDGFKFREKPAVKSAGSSIAALTSGGKTSVTNAKTERQAQLESLQVKANSGDKKAQDNLLMAKLNAMRGR